LPAAGIISLSLLNRSFKEQEVGVSVSKVYQDLSVLVAEVETGALVDFQHPNYALLSDATRTIKTLLDRLILSDLARVPEFHPESANPAASLTMMSEDNGVPWTIQDTWDFETNFWHDLAGHPFLLGNDDASNGLS
jgi:hypothetical protein